MPCRQCSEPRIRPRIASFFAEPGYNPAMISDEFDREAYRKRLHKMTDLELLQHSKAARDLFESEVSEFQELYAIRLEECRAEWKRRHPND
jgi:hypothetical protein